MNKASINPFFVLTCSTDYNLDNGNHLNSCAFPRKMR